MKPRRLVLLIAGCVAVALAAAAENGTLLKPETLRATPYLDSKTVASLKTGDRIEILGRQAGWYRVTANRRTGWVRMLSVRTGAVISPVKTTVNAARSVLDRASGRSASGAIVATTGIRALDAAALKAAVRNDSELAKLDAFAASADEARRFAAKEALAARKLDYLPAPRAAGR